MSPLIAVDLLAFAALVITWALAPMRAPDRRIAAGQASAPSLAAESAA